MSFVHSLDCVHIYFHSLEMHKSRINRQFITHKETLINVLAMKTLSFRSTLIFNFHYNNDWAKASGYCMTLLMKMSSFHLMKIPFLTHKDNYFPDNSSKS